MCVLNGAADVEKKFQARGGREIVLLAVIVDGLAMNQLHYEIRNTAIGGAAIEQARNVGVVEPGQDLPLLLEARDNESGILARSEPA